MEKSEKENSIIEKTGENLFNYAVDRQDIKTLMTHLHEEADIRRATVEYELQILKIIMVGWSISYYLENHPEKDTVAERYWSQVHTFSSELSTTTEYMTGHDIDYFQVLKDRLDVYLDALNKKPDASEPVMVIGPEFARTCGNQDDVFTVMTGSRMFTAATGAVKEYLEEIRLR